MNRKQQAYRNAGIYMGAFFLLLLLLRLDVRAIGADGTNVGLSHLNGAVHFITRSHPWIYAFTQLLGWVALVVAASFVLLAVGVLIKKRTLRSLRGIACLFPVYALMIPFAFFFNVFTVNCGPAFFRGETHPSNSFPSMTTVFGNELVHGYFGGGAAEPVADQPVQGPLHSRGESVIGW